jgi:hypothetical protein
MHRQGSLTHPGGTADRGNHHRAAHLGPPTQQAGQRGQLTGPAGEVRHRGGQLPRHHLPTSTSQVPERLENRQLQPIGAAEPGHDQTCLPQALPKRIDRGPVSVDQLRRQLGGLVE